jgi:hypothetical protein
LNEQQIDEVAGGVDWSKLLNEAIAAVEAAADLISKIGKPQAESTF